MRYYCAPMEGLTGRIYRAAHRRHFPGVDKYIMPFVSPTQNHRFTAREREELAPTRDWNLGAVPQLLTRSAEDFLWAARALGELGYNEVNLNLGCPSGTVVAKGKGSGFLAAPEALDRFLDEVFTATPVAVSIKTRLGKESPEEFPPLLEIYNRYPIAELTIHPRIQKDFYKYPVRREAFAQALPRCASPVCYNGDLATAGECRDFAASFPGVGAVMLGRGLMADPALIVKAKGGSGAGRETLLSFHNDLYRAYSDAFGSSRNAIMRMKELWSYQLCLFEGSADYGKRLRKVTQPAEYTYLVATLFRDCPLRADAVAGWRA